VPPHCPYFCATPVAVEDEAVEDEVFVEDDDVVDTFIVVVVVVELVDVAVLDPPPIGVTLDGTSPPMTVVIGACSM